MIWSNDSYYPNWNFERNVFGTTDCVSLLFCCSRLYGFFNKPQSNQASKKEHSKESTNLCDTDILSLYLFFFPLKFSLCFSVLFLQIYVSLCLYLDGSVPRVSLFLFRVSFCLFFLHLLFFLSFHSYFSTMVTFFLSSIS